MLEGSFNFQVMQPGSYILIITIFVFKLNALSIVSN